MTEREGRPKVSTRHRNEGRREGESHLTRTFTVWPRKWGHRVMCTQDGSEYIYEGRIPQGELSEVGTQTCILTFRNRVRKWSRDEDRLE